MKHRFLNFAITLFISGIALTQSGCKEDTIIKASVAPSVGNVNLPQVPDTITIISKTVLDDSTVTGYSFNGIRVIHGLGAVNDPFFGRSTWGIYTQFTPPSGNFSLPANSTVDSACLVLPYTGFSWGDTNATTTVSYAAYRLTEDMYKDTGYYSFQKLQQDRSFVITEAATFNFASLRKDSVKVAGINRAPHLRMKLKSAFINDVLTNAKNSNDNAAFLKEVKGIYIESKDTNTAKAVPYFFLDGTYDYGRASIACYYHTSDSPSVVKTAFFNFNTASCAHFNHVTRNYNGSLAKQYIQSTLTSDSAVLLQNEPGTAIDLVFPYLKNLPVSIINQAQLVITEISLANDPEAETYSRPSRIFPVGIDASGKTYNIADREPLTESSPVTFIDGTLKQTTVNGMLISQYVINIPREVQKVIVNRTDKLHLRINGTATFPGAYRLVAGGRSHSKFSVKLNIIYSKL